MSETDIVRTRLASRTSFFGGAVSTRDDIRIRLNSNFGLGYMTRGNHDRNLDNPSCPPWRNNGEVGKCPDTVENNNNHNNNTTTTSKNNNSKKKSIVPSSYPGKGGSMRGTASLGTFSTTEKKPVSQRHQHKMRTPRGVRSVVEKEDRRRPLAEHARETVSYTTLKKEGSSLVRRRGTFYGKAQPPSALQPIPQRPSYSDESDIESLIDDDDIDNEDVGWVGELINTLGTYATKDFSKIDAQRDSRMQASFDQIMDEEHQTARIGLDVDREEAQRARKKRRRSSHSRWKKTTTRERHLVLCSSSDDDDEE